MADPKKTYRALFFRPGKKIPLFIDEYTKDDAPSEVTIGKLKFKLTGRPNKTHGVFMYMEVTR